MKNVFQKIIDKEINADIVFENESVIAIKDIAPKAPIHFLIITKKEIPSLQEMEESDFPLLGEIVKVAQKLVAKFDIKENGYRLLVNNGMFAGQTIAHLHFHLLGGGPLGQMA